MQRYQDEPIEIGVRLKPQTRAQRRVAQDRDYMEKQRVMSRHENFERHEEAGFGSGMYNEHHRFGDQFEQLERDRRAALRQQKQEYYQQLGQQAAQRQQMYDQRTVENMQRKDQAVQQRGNHKNQSGENFNILTREYTNQEDQERESRRYEIYKISADARRENLMQKQGGGINLLTGEPYSWARK